MAEELPNGFFSETNLFSGVAIGFKQNISNPVYLDVNTLVSDTQPELVADILAINNSIFNILSTHKGSRIFRPTYGSNLLNLIHEPADQLTEWRIKNELIDAIERWEPRIRLLAGATKVQKLASGTEYQVFIAYEILISKVITKVEFVLTQ